MIVDRKRVEDLFAATLAQSPADRATFLGQACGDDAGLRERVARLLEAHRQAGTFLEGPAGDLGDSAVLDTPTQAFDSTSAAGQPESSPPTQTEPLRAPEEVDLSFLSPSDKPGSLGRLAHYEVQEVIGKGGFGTVFKAFDELLHRVVAIKAMAPQMAASAAARHRFLREARAAAAVRHEHVVGIHAVAREDEPLPYLVMEYVNGQTLQQKLDDVGPLEVKEILRIGMQIARGLSAAHKQGLIHRDIKPGNILLENGIEHVKITDFGLARTMDDASVTQSGVVAGTPMYMSPEQAEGLTLDHRSDLFSLGTVLYVMCTGRPPFRASGTIAVLKRVVEETPRPIRDINSEIPPWLCDVVEKLHAKKPEERYQTANEVAELLGQRLADVQMGRVIEERAESREPPGDAPVSLFKFKLSGSNFGPIPDPSPEVIRQQLQKMTEEPHGSHLLLQNIDNEGFFVQVMWTKAGFVLGYGEERPPERFYNSKRQDFFVEEVAAVFIAFLQGNEHWHAGIHWQEMDLPKMTADANVAGASKTQPRPPSEPLDEGETLSFPPAVRIPFFMLVSGALVAVVHMADAMSAERAEQSMLSLLGFAAIYVFGLYGLAAWEARRRGTWRGTVIGASPWGVTLILFAMFLLDILLLASLTQGLSAFLPIWARPRETRELPQPPKGVQPVQMPPVVGDPGGVQRNALRGKWLLLSGEANGEPLPKEFLSAVRIAIDDAFELKIADSFESRNLIVLDGAASPKTIRSIPGNTKAIWSGDGGKVQEMTSLLVRRYYINSEFRGIYELEGNKLKLCIAQGGYSPPKRFDSRTDDGAQFGALNLVLVRDEVGWVQLFNGKDIEGWQTHPTRPGKWEVKDNILTNSGSTGYLFKKIDFKRFHLRLVARVKDSGNGGVHHHVPELPLPGDTPGGPHISISSEGFRLVKAGGFQLTHPPQPSGEWFTLEALENGGQTEIRVNDRKSWNADITTRPGGPYIALSSAGPEGLQFKKIEIKELPPEPPPFAKLPDTAEQVLPALAGAWKGEYTQKIYGGKPDVKKISAVAVNEWIVGQKWLRQRVQMENEGFQSVTAFEPGSKIFRDWFFHSRGLVFGPSTGRWDPANRTLTWTNLPEAGVILLMTLRFVDADTFAGDILIRDKEGKTDFEMSSLMKRTTENVTIDENAAAGPLPPEMAVLDRLVGDWQTTGIIKNGKNPERLKASWQSSVRRILGGRVIATERAGYPGDDESYSLATFDTFSKAYGRWSFRANGNVMEYGGLWDEDNQTLKWHWAGKDGSQSSNTWPLRDPNRRDWQVHTKDALGKTTFEVQATSVRQSELRPAPAVERFVARWALEAGGSVAIRVENGDARTGIADIASLPAGNFTVELVDLSNSRKVTETMLGTLAGAKDLRELVLRGLPIGDGGLSQLLVLEKLEKLDLTGAKVTDRALVILSELRNLKSLTLENTAIGDGVLRLLEETKQLERLQGLTHLNVGKTALTAAGVQALAKALPKCAIVSDHK